MTTPLIMLMVMTAPYVIVRLWSAMTRRHVDLRGAAASGLAMLFLFTGAGHFIQTAPMAQMLPPWVPARMLLVYVTGVLECALAVGFLVRQSRRLTGWLAVVVLVVFFPVNVYAALYHIPMGGHAWGPGYLLVRAPLQLIIGLWVYWFTIRRPGAGMPPAPASRHRHQA